MTFLVLSSDRSAVDESVVGAKSAMLSRIARWPVEDRPVVAPAATITTEAWRAVVDSLDLERIVRAALDGDADASAQVSVGLRRAVLPSDVEQAVQDSVAITIRSGSGLVGAGVALRSSAVAEDRPGRSYAGQYRSSLAVVGDDAALDAYRSCLASAWEPGARAYASQMGPARYMTGDVLNEAAMAVLVQPMVHGGEGRSGAALSDGHGSVTVEIVDGLAESMMAGRGEPSRWEIGASDGPCEDRLVDLVVQWTRLAERRCDCPVQVEFAAAAGSDVPVVLQLRSAVFTDQAERLPTSTSDDVPGRRQAAISDPAISGPVVSGAAVGHGIVRGRVCLIESLDRIDRFESGGVLVTRWTDPSWVSLMAASSAVVTDEGGVTSHAAVVCRELGVPAVVGCGDATGRLAHGAEVEIRLDGPTGTIHLVG